LHSLTVQKRTALGTALRITVAGAQCRWQCRWFAQSLAKSCKPENEFVGWLSQSATLVRTQHREQLTVGHILRLRTGYVQHPWQDSNRSLALPLLFSKCPSIHQTQKSWEVSDEEGTQYRALSVHRISPGAKIKMSYACSTPEKLVHCPSSGFRVSI
jgi:hypothetical protein